MNVYYLATGPLILIKKNLLLFFNLFMNILFSFNLYSLVTDFLIIIKKF
jgi:hypothetical protein